MEEQLISFETAKLAKDKGVSISGYLNDVFLGEDFSGKYGKPIYGLGTTSKLPTQSLLQKWLREEHQILLEIVYLSKFESWIAKFPLCDDVFIFDGGTYEEALEEGLVEALKLIN